MTGHVLTKSDSYDGHNETRTHTEKVMVPVSVFRDTGSLRALFLPRTQVRYLRLAFRPVKLFSQGSTMPLVEFQTLNPADSYVVSGERLQ